MGISSKNLATLDCFVGAWFNTARSSGLTSISFSKTLSSFRHVIIVNDDESPLAITLFFDELHFRCKSVIN